jgi:hypothetical protein
MIFQPEHLFQPSYNENIQKMNGFYVVDNFFKNFKMVQKCLYECPHENYHMSESSRNFKDYYDCRTIFRNVTPDESMVEKRKKYFSRLLNSTKEWEHHNPHWDPAFYFNIFKMGDRKLAANRRWGQVPHIENTINMIIYIDGISDGGTALYKKNYNIEQQETDDALMDITDYEYDLIEARPNRMVLFDGNRLHGAAVNDYDKYRNEPRINMVQFF